MKRLYLNQGRYQGQTLDVAGYLLEFHAAALARHWSAVRFARIGDFDLHGYRRGPTDAGKSIYISTGIHGDEPAGPVALRRLVEEDRWPEGVDLVLCPCINPTGLRSNTRENMDGVDLNRDYRNTKSAEVRAHIEWLKTVPDFDMTLILHEDWEADGYYVYEVNPEEKPSPGRRIIDSVREACPIQPDSTVDGLWDCVEGIIHPHIPPEDRPLWAEALYLIMNKTRLSLTLETPSDYPLALRVEAHVRAVRAALK